MLPMTSAAMSNSMTDFARHSCNTESKRWLFPDLTHCRRRQGNVLSACAVRTSMRGRAAGISPGTEPSCAR